MVLVDQKSQLFPLLQIALELELATIPPYMTALLSIEKQANRTAASLIRSVMMEEMLHMVLVGNLISSLGSKVQLGKENIPIYPLRLKFEGKEFADRAFDIDLRAFSPESVQTFMQIEMPASLFPKQFLFSEKLIIPNITIGAFYLRIINMLEQMCADFPESEVFCGNPSDQITQQYYWGGGKPIVITSLNLAKAALNVVIEQGEGGEGSIFDGDDHYFDQPEEVAHYFRFKEIASSRHYQSTDKPQDPPSGEFFSVDYKAVLPIKRNAKISDYAAGTYLATLNNSFNRHYTLMLNQIEQAFNGTPSVLYDAIVNGMHAMTPIAIEMMNTPIAGDETGAHGAPSFEWVSPLLAN